MAETLRAGEIAVPVCGLTNQRFVPEYSLLAAIDGRHQEARCPRGKYIAVECLDEEGGLKICYFCVHCHESTEMHFR